MTTYAVRTIPGGGTLADAHAVRRAVFIDEQDVSEDVEMDGRDDEATHVVVSDRERDLAVATARLRAPDGVAKAERVAVLKKYRGRGIGRRVMGLLEAIARTQGYEKMELHAQTAVEGFYAALGYETVSDVFEEADIPHVEMKKPL